MRILISGAGIAGPTLAYWLLRYGIQPTLVERAPRLRTGGYVIDFWGTGYDVAERMGLLPDLKRVGYMIEELRFVDARGRRTGGISVDVFRAATRDRYVSLPRGDLAAAIYGTVAERAPVMFGDHIVAIDRDDDGVRVKLAHAPEQRFDLVIGADGLHSGVRRVVFGDEARFEKHLGYCVAEFEVTGYRPRDELVYVSYAQPGKQVTRFAMRDDRTMFVLVFATDPGTEIDADSIEQQKRVLHDRFDDAGWECPRIMAALDSCGELYFDRVSQIRMDSWSRGQVALVGDAAYCVSLLAGQGSALAMTGAYVLVGELHRANGNHHEAFARYEETLRPFITGKQDNAARVAGSFVPRTQFGIVLRSLVTRAFAIPFVADRVLGNSVVDHFALPDYAEPSSSES